MRKRPLKYLLLGILSFGLLVGCILYISPVKPLPFVPLPFSAYYLFFLLLAGFLFSIISFLFKSKKHGILLALFVCIYLIFRITNLTHPFFLILLIALFLTLELLVSYRK